MSDKYRAHRIQVQQQDLLRKRQRQEKKARKFGDSVEQGIGKVRKFFGFSSKFRTT